MFQKQVVHIKVVTSWNSFSYYVRDKTKNSLENRKNIKNSNTLEQQDIGKIFRQITYARVQGEVLIKTLVIKLE